MSGHDAVEPAPLAWRPQPGPQTAFVESDAFEVVYGGARGGGKTDAALGDFAFHAEAHGRYARGLLVRRTRVALEPTIRRAREIFRPWGAVWVESKSMFRWPSGATLAFRHLDRDADAEGYQGHDYSRVYVEELTQFTSPLAVDKLKATLRSAGGAPCGFRATCNPGGPGHNWVKARYIDAGAHRIVAETFVSPFDGARIETTRQFIPARLTDNPALLARDPAYVARLAQSGSAALVRAWLEGDWTVIEGAFFDGWSQANIVEPFTLPESWQKFRAFDWGHAAPFSVGWWAVAEDRFAVPGGRILPRGTLVRYREWYGAERPGVGVRLTAEEVAAGILARERAAGERVALGYADPSIFATDGGPSVGERMRGAGVALTPADNTRVGKAGALSGWDQMRARLRDDGGGPRLVVFSTCRDFIRTVPVLQHDPHRPEDLDSSGEDHIADETRYACLARRLPRPPPPPELPWRPDDWGRPGPPVNAWMAC